MLDARIRRVGFTVETRLSPAGILEASDHARERAGRYAPGTLEHRVLSTHDDTYVVRGRGGEAQLAFTVAWHKVGPGLRLVRLSASDQMAPRSRLPLLRVGHRWAPALTIYRRFAEALRQELEDGG